MDIDDESPRRSLARRLLRGAVVALLLVCALLALAVVWLRSNSAADLGRRIAIEQLSKLVGEDVHLTSIEVLDLLPPRVEVRGLSVHSTSPERMGLPLLLVDRLAVTLGGDPDLERRVIPLDDVSVHRPRARVSLETGRLRDFSGIVELLEKKPEDPNEPTKKPVRVDVRRVEVDDLGARLSVEPPGLGAAVSGVWLDFDQSLATATTDGRATARRTAPGSLRVDDIEVVIGEIRERASLERGSFDVEDGLLTFNDYGLALRTGRVDLSGQLPIGPPRPSGPGYRLDAKADIDLSAVHDAWPKLPELAGIANLRVGVQGRGAHPEIDYDLTATDVQALVHGPRKDLLFKLGDLSLRGYYLEDLLKVTRSSVRWAGGRVGVEVALVLRKDMPFDAKLDIDGLDLARILDGVTVPGSWVQMMMTGSIEMEGRIKDPQRGLWGSGSARIAARDLIVRDGAWDAPVEHSTMLHVPRADIVSGVTLDAAGVHLVGGQVKGPHGSDLAVDTDFIFARPMGLRVHAAGPLLDMRDLQDSIVGLNVQGKGGIEVDIEGPSNDLDIVGRLELEDFVFLKWPFGRVQGDVHWHARKDLEFTRLLGQRGESAFESEVRVLFADVSRGGTREQLEIDVVTSVPDGHARAEDLLPIFFGDAIGLKGRGFGEAHLYGPPGALNGEGYVRVSDAEYLWERFETVDMDVVLRDGDLFITEGWARKPSGASVFARGAIGREGEVDVAFQIADMGAEELEPVRAAGWPLTGRLSGAAVLSGDLSNTWVDGRLRLVGAKWGKEELGDSDIRLAVQNHVATASADALDGRLNGFAELTLQGIWPYTFSVKTNGDLS
ncbi:MAG: hypothetical protein KDA24_09870, partial [Deltaproteobacteria bacterium]|nr:hypothetical protein [Deltaproteobacteria bacterium]